MKYFKNRFDAGEKLAKRLLKFKDEKSVLLAVPRGGVQVAFPIAQKLNIPMSLILAKKIGHPKNKEFSIGAASLDNYFVLPHADVSEAYIQSELVTIRARLRQMFDLFLKGRKQVDVKGKIVVIIDDGIATGNTLLTSIKLLRRQSPAKIIIAVPVASRSAVNRLSEEVDELISLYTPEVFVGIGGFYYDFEQVTDSQVIELLEKISP